MDLTVEQELFVRQGPNCHEIIEAKLQQWQRKIDQVALRFLLKLDFVGFTPPRHGSQHATRTQISCLVYFLSTYAPRRILS